MVKLINGLCILFLLSCLTIGTFVGEANLMDRSPKCRPRKQIFWLKEAAVGRMMTVVALMSMLL